RAARGAGPPDGGGAGHLALLPAAHLPGLALFGLHHGARPLEGGVRRDPRLDRRAHRHRGAGHAVLVHGVQEGAAPVLHRRLPALGSRARLRLGVAGGARSRELYRRALRVLPGGVNSPVRAMRAIGRDPVFVERAAGSELVDVDGNAYVDWVCSWGPLILGHAHPDVLAAVGEAAAAAATSVDPWNDAGALAAAVDEHEVAAILAEPYPANMGLVPPGAGFLEQLRASADRAGALLVFDEVISGFRVAPGGAQELAGVGPDLTILGKVLGGGLPAAALGGGRALLERLAPAGDVYQAGTLSGNPLAVAAGLATLRRLDEDAYARLTATTRALADGLREAAGERPVQVVAETGLLTLFFSAEPVRDWTGAAACDREAYGAWCRGLLDRGVYAPPSQFEAWFPSLAHTTEDVEMTVAAAAEAFAEVA